LKSLLKKRSTANETSERRAKGLSTRERSWKKYGTKRTVAGGVGSGGSRPGRDKKKKMAGRNRHEKEGERIESTEKKK